MNTTIGKARISFGKIALYGNRRINEADVTMELRVTGGDPTFVMNGKERVYTGNFTPKRLEFSVCGDVWNLTHTDIVMGGQCLDDMPVTIPLFKEIRELWRKYHLNTMHAGTPEQEAAIKEWRGDTRRDYTETCEYLKSIGLYEVDWEGEKYKYGHAWLYFPIPHDDLARIVEIMREHGKVSDEINEWLKEGK